MKKLNLEKDEIVKLYDSGMGCYKISKIFSCSPSTINNFLKKHKVNTQKTPNNYRKYTLNENYFEKIDSEVKSYFLGLIYSDGCITKSSLRITLQEEDSYILEKLLKELSADAKLYDIKKRKITHKNQKLLAISNKKIVNDLNSLGVFQNKSLSIEFPTNDILPIKYLPHFIRGVFDGDGSVFNYERMINNKKYIEYGLTIISTEHFIKKLNEILNCGNIYKTNNGKNYFISFKNKKDIKKIVDFLYQDSTIHLNRKYEKVKEILEFLENKKFYYDKHKIAQYDLNGELIKIWNDIDEIKMKTNYNTQTILRNIRNKIKTSNGFKFKIYD